MRRKLGLSRIVFSSLLSALLSILSAGLVSGSATGIVAAGAAGPTAKEIIDRMDKNAYSASVHLVARLIIKGGRREIAKEMEAWIAGKEKALVTFLNPGDRGTKYLKLGNELWMFFPDAEDLVKISGHMLKQGMMGSDFSYEDALESEKMAELYDSQLVGIEVYDGAKCYVIEAVALPGKTVSYPKRKMWIDSERFVARKEELYAASGKLLKVSWVEELKEKDGRIYASRAVMEDRLKRGSSTTFVVERIEFDVRIPEGLFSLRSLMR